MWDEGIGGFSQYIRRAEGGGVESFVAERFFGFQPEDIEWATSLGQQFGDREQYDGKGDAARHLALGWLASRAENPQRAQRAIDLREDLDPSNWMEYFRSFRREDRARPGYEMDVQNNALGASIPATTKEEAAEIIRAMVENAEAVYMTPQESYVNRGYRDGGYVSRAAGQGIGGLSHIARTM